MGGAEALHEVRHIEIDVGVPSRYEVVDDPGFGRADRGRVRGCPAGDGGGRAAPGHGRDPDGSVCLVVKTSEEKSSVSSVRAPRRPLDQPRRRFLMSLGARLCIRYLPIGIGAVHGIAWLCMRPSLAGWGSPENWQFSGLREGVLGLVRYVRPEYERTQAEICGFLACLSQRLRDAVLRIVLTLVRTDDDCVLSLFFR